jgi:hypothetical protein
MTKPVAEEKKEKLKPSWKLPLLLPALTGVVVLSNSYLLVVGAGFAFLQLDQAVGGWGTLTVFVFLSAVIFFLPPLISWRKSNKGRPAIWCLAWNVGLVVVTLAFGPIGNWMRSQGATPVALVLGKDSWAVETLLGEQLGWGTGLGAPTLGKIKGSEPFVERWAEIVKTLQGARSLQELLPVVRQANLDRVKAWPEKQQLLALKHVRDKIELHQFDAQRLKREWQLYDFDQNENTVLLIWRAYEKDSRDDFLSQDVKLVKEDGQWKADFTLEIENFDKIIQRRESSSDR